MSRSNGSSIDGNRPVGAGLDEVIGVGNGAFVCHALARITSRGIWFGDNPLSFSLPLLLLQLSLISIFTRSIYISLKTFGQPPIVSQILGGVILGPSILGHNLSFAEKVFPSNGRMVLETLSSFGFMLFIFLIGVKIDPSIILKSGKRAFVIGSLGFLLPYALASSVRLFICHFVSLEDSKCKMLQQVAKVQSISSFPVITVFLAELKILNSEIGRIASSSSIVCEVFYWSVMSVDYLANIAIKRSLKASVCYFLSAGLLLSFIVFAVRPAALWAIRRTPEGKSVKEIYIFVALMTLIFCGFIGQVVGVNALASSFVVGLVIPDGPPLGATLVERLDCFVSALLMPIFFTLCGLKTNVFTIQNWQTVGVIQLVGFAAFFGKILGTTLPPLLFRMPFRDALSLALIMNSKGIVELMLLSEWRRDNVINDECFGIMIISVVVVTGVISPLVKSMYDPSKRFVAYKRRTIRHHRHNEELRMLACIHSEDNVRTMITLIDASNPSKQNPIGLFVLHLIKLAGRASPLLIAHLPREKPSQNPSQSERIFSAFAKFEQENRSHVTVQYYKGISPYATMHNDVCSVALDQRIAFIIIPLYKVSRDRQGLEAIHAYRHLNKNVFEKAPCSVGVLMDRSKPRKCPYILEEPPFYRVAVLFFGGADDREALAYATRMSEHHHVLVTLLHFTTSRYARVTEIVEGTARSKVLDSEILDEFRTITTWNKRVSYHEEVVIDSKGVIAVIESIENAFDLVMAGRRHGDSWLMSDLRKWTEHRELGEVGEMIAARDCKLGASVLVVQQQTRVWGLRDTEESLRLRRTRI